MDQATRASNRLDQGKFKSLRKAAAAAGVANRPFPIDGPAGTLDPPNANHMPDYILNKQLFWSDILSMLNSNMRLLIRLNWV